MIAIKKKDNLIFFSGYILYFITLFMEDLPIEIPFLLMAFKLIRYLAYVLFTINICKQKYKKNDFLISLAFFVAFSLISIFTKDIYFVVILTIIASSTQIKTQDLFSISYWLLLTLSLMVMILMLLKILPNDDIVKGNGLDRYTLGYYHSNVFPLVILYIISYRMIIKKRLQKRELIFWAILGVITYYLCRSRAGILGMLFLLTSYLIISYYPNKIHLNNFLKLLLFKYSAVIFFILSIIMVVLQPLGNHYIYIINKLVSGRFALGYHKMLAVGLHFFNVMDGEAYLDSEITVDSGYIYVALRYGLAFILFYALIQRNIFLKYKNEFVVVICFTTFVLTNIIDNDLFSYGFLPYIISAFSKCSLKEYKNTILNALLKKGQQNE